MRDAKTKSVLLTRLTDSIEQAIALTGGYVTLEKYGWRFAISGKPKRCKQLLFRTFFLSLLLTIDPRN